MIGTHNLKHTKEIINAFPSLSSKLYTNMYYICINYVVFTFHLVLSYHPTTSVKKANSPICM